MTRTSDTWTALPGFLPGPLPGFLAVSLLALTLGVWAWEPVPAGVWHDDGAYLLLAKSLAEGDGLRYAGVPETPPGAKFPPLYPVTLGHISSASAPRMRRVIFSAAR